jgi:2-polyprenyl-3-methyl-5-hydroxy-6-metoxy-1,4-benzoquinol methylase
MRSRSKAQGPPAVLSTHDIGIDLPANRKYLAGNPPSRLLIRRFLQALVDLTRELKPSSVLDIGCGEGLVIRQLGASFAQLRIHGLDISPELLRVAQSVAPSGTYTAGDAYQLPLQSNCYDLVICTEVLEHVDRPDRAIAEIVRVGTDHVLLSVPHEPLWRVANLMRGKYLADRGNTPGHVNHWSRRGFIQFASNHLHVLAVRHPFPWTVVLGRVHP